jgi:hypothetical protein
VLQVLGERLFIAWVEDAAAADQPSTLMGAELDAAGNWTRAPFAIAPASRTMWNLNADTVDAGSVALVFDAETETQASELYLALVSAEMSNVLRLSADDGQASKYPDIAVHAGRGALTWFDMKDGNAEVYLSSVDIGDPSAAMVDASARAITQTPGESSGAYLAWNGATLGLAWNDDSAGQHEIFFQAFDAGLQPLAPARQLTQSAAQSLVPSIVAHGTGFALA